MNRIILTLILALVLVGCGRKDRVVYQECDCPETELPALEPEPEEEPVDDESEEMDPEDPVVDKSSDDDPISDSDSDSRSEDRCKKTCEITEQSGSSSLFAY